MRREELVRLKLSDLDSDRMLIRVRQGKGKKDRDVMLSPTVLAELRQYWRSVNSKQGSPNRIPFCISRA